jgi:hypothetical protein
MYQTDIAGVSSVLFIPKVIYYSANFLKVWILELRYMNYNTNKYISYYSHSITHTNFREYDWLDWK